MWTYIGITPVRPSVRRSVGPSVRPSTIACVRDTGQSFYPIHMKLGMCIHLDNISDKFENGAIPDFGFWVIALDLMKNR